MAITTACPNCGKKYRAADQMAGRRVKCRGCGAAFSLTGGADDDIGLAVAGGDSDVDLSALETPSDPFAGMGNGAATGAATAATRAPATSPFGASFPRDRDPDSIFQAAFAIAPPTRNRANVPFPYPGSRQLDQWLPTLLPIIAFLWVTVQAFVSNNSGAGWTPIIRVLVLALGFIALVFPAGWMAVKFAARQAKFELPPSPRKRVAAAMAFALSIPAALYLSLGSFGSAIPGLILGLIVAMGCIWLLIRIKPPEAGTTMGMVAAAFVGSTLLLGGVLMLASMMTVSMLGNSKTQLAESPFGPGLPWAAPAPPAKPKEQRPAEPVQIADAGSGRTATTEPAGAGPTTPVPTSPTPPVSPSPSSPTPGAISETPGPKPQPATSNPATADPNTKPPAVAAVEKPAATDPPKPPELFPNSKLFSSQPLPKPKPVSNPGRPEDEDPDAGPTEPPPPKPVGPPAPPAQVPADYAAASGDPVAFSILGAKSPVVVSVRSAQAIGPFERVVPALTSSNIALVVKHGNRADGDLLEAWDLSSLKRLGAAEVKRDVAEHVAVVNNVPSYAASPDGLTWARLTTFPTLSLEITTLAGNSAPIRLPLKDPMGEGTVLGYASPDRVLVRWRNAENVTIDVWDIKARTQASHVILPPHPSSSCNGVFSGDGKWLAVAGAQGVRGGAFKPSLVLIDLATHQTPRTIVITGIDAQRAVRPSGMAFSSDGSRIGLLYEQNGNTVLLGYRVTATALTPTEPLAAPAGKVAPLADESILAGRLTSVAGGKDWLVGGSVVLDADTGAVLGDFGVEVPCAQVSNGTEAIIVSGDAGQRRMTLVRTKEEAKKPAAPATKLTK